MPDVEVGINDRERQGKEIVGRHDIIPIKTEEWIRIIDEQFHPASKWRWRDWGTDKQTERLTDRQIDGQGKEIVGRHDIIPIKTEEWIRIIDEQFNPASKWRWRDWGRDKQTERLTDRQIDGQGKEIVGRHDIIPIKTKEWIRIIDEQFHPESNWELSEAGTEGQANSRTDGQTDRQTDRQGIYIVGRPNIIPNKIEQWIRII